MRELAEAGSVRAFMREVGKAARREMFDAIRPSLYRYPAIDPDSFARALEAALAAG